MSRKHRLTLLCVLLRLFFERPPPGSNILMQYSKELMGRESKAPLSTKTPWGEIALCLHQSKRKASVSCVPCTLMRYAPAARASCVAHNTLENVKKTKNVLPKMGDKAKLKIFEISGG